MDILKFTKAKTMFMILCKEQAGEILITSETV